MDAELDNLAWITNIKKWHANADMKMINQDSYLVRFRPEFINWHNDSNWQDLRKRFNYHQYYALTPNNTVRAYWDFEPDVIIF